MEERRGKRQFPGGNGIKGKEASGKTREMERNATRHYMNGKRTRNKKWRNRNKKIGSNKERSEKKGDAAQPRQKEKKMEDVSKRSQSDEGRHGTQHKKKVKQQAGRPTKE